MKAIYGDEAVDVNLDRDAVVLVDLQLPGHRWLHVCCSRHMSRVGAQLQGHRDIGGASDLHQTTKLHAFINTTSKPIRT